MTIECCFCREETDDTATVCENCGAIFRGSTIQHFDLMLTEKKTSLRIEICGEAIAKMTDSTMILGREGDIAIELLSGYKFISRKHCTVIYDNGKYKIESISSSTNPTKINNKKIALGIKTTLSDGDILTIADVDFSVSICKKENIVQTDNVLNYDDNIHNRENITEFVVSCPKCPAQYIVTDKNDKISECGSCHKSNKHKIADETAKEVVKSAN